MFKRLFYSIALPITLLVAVDWSLAIRFDTDAPHSVSVIGSGLIAFIAAFTVLREKLVSTDDADSALRRGIAAAIVVQYLVLVGIVAFFAPAKEGETLGPLTQTLISNFTTVVGIVIAFYFGSSAYLSARKSQQGDSMRAEPQNPANRGGP